MNNNELNLETLEARLEMEIVAPVTNGGPGGPIGTTPICVCLN